MEIISLSFLALLIGIRHGMDGDHVAAIADMVGAEQEKRKQVTMGVLYALGHGSIVFIIGMLAIFLGVQLPAHTLQMLEMLVAATLFILGVYIIYSILSRRKEYRFKGITALFLNGMNQFFAKNKTQLSPIMIGIIGAFVVGLIHGIGVESPSQLLILSNVAGVGDDVAAIIQLALFVVGILLSTVCITLLITFGFMKAQLKRKLYLIFGSITGIYSVGLGLSMMIEIL